MPACTFSSTSSSNAARTSSLRSRSTRSRCTRFRQRLNMRGISGTRASSIRCDYASAWTPLSIIYTRVSLPSFLSNVNRKWSSTKLRQIDLHWHDLGHEGACRLLADGVDIRIIQLMLGHASVQQTQRYLNVTDEQLRKGLEVSWKRRTFKAVVGGQNR
ncbi:MAG: tyrosine-type recombinase/integrase [Luteitalea sp.]|nr:tyrosine-type recombinase/integrase [Luteitalea sp.]